MTGGREKSVPSPIAQFYVLDDADRVTQVSPALHASMGSFLGHVIWDCLPSAEPIFRARYDEARRTGRESEFAVFYGGSTATIRAVPAAGRLAVYVRPGTALRVTTLGTLLESLRQIQEELAARAQLPPAPPGLESLRALP